MLIRRPLICGTVEADQLDKVFKLVGYPQGDALKFFSSLKHWGQFNVDEQAVNTLGQLRSRDNKELDKLSLHLLQDLLNLNPIARPTCKKALTHHYLGGLHNTTVTNK